MQSLWPHNNPGHEKGVTWKYRTVWEARWVISLLFWDGCTQNTDLWLLKMVQFCAIFPKINYCYRCLDCIALDCIMYWKVKSFWGIVGFFNTFFVCYHNCISVALKIILKIEWVPCWKGGTKNLLLFSFPAVKNCCLFKHRAVCWHGNVETLLIFPFTKIWNQKILRVSFNTSSSGL